MNPEPKYNKLRKKFYDQDEFYKLRRDFVEKVASYVSEFMICFLLSEQNFNVKFVQNIGNQKKYDLLLDDIPCDIKTILDEYPWFDQPENQLQEELIKSLKHTKVQEKIEEAMKQGARIIFLSATQTSMGKGANQETGKKIITGLTIERATAGAINFIKSNNVSRMPLVVVAASVDYDCRYRITAFYVDYPTVLSPKTLTIKNVHVGRISQ